METDEKIILLEIISTLRDVAIVSESQQKDWVQRLFPKNI